MGKKSKKLGLIFISLLVIAFIAIYFVGFRQSILPEGSYSANNDCTLVTNAKYTDGWDDYRKDGLWIAVDRDDDGKLEGYIYDREKTHSSTRPSTYSTGGYVIKNCKDESIVTKTSDGLLVIRIKVISIGGRVGDITTSAQSEWVAICSDPLKTINRTEFASGEINETILQESSSIIAYFKPVDEFVPSLTDKIIISCQPCSNGEERCDGYELERCVNNGWRKIGRVEGKCQYTIDMKLVEEIDSLEGSLQLKVQKIIDLTDNLESQSFIIDNLQLSVDEKAEVIKQLTKNTEEQAQIINNLKLTSHQQAELILKLNTNIDEQAELIKTLELTRDKQVEVISNLNLNINEQAQMINFLTKNLQEKALLVEQLQSTNEEQAELIKAMKLSFSDQAGIIDSLNKKVSDDAEIISNLDLKLDEQAQLISELKLTKEEQAQLIDELELKLNEQEELIDGLKITIEEKKELVGDLELTLKEKEKIINKLESKSNTLMYFIYGALGLLVIFIIVTIIKKK